MTGYVEELETVILKNPAFTLIGKHDTPFYSSRRFATKAGGVVNLVGVKSSFWGCISAKLATQFCRLGAREIIYVGKLGTLTQPQDIYNRIFAPSRFFIMYHDQVVCHINDLPNRFLAEHPTLSTEAHVSVPTVVEEDYIQRSITSRLKFESIDNEISQIAFAVARYNRDFHKRISYTALHFATDYIRRPHERGLEVKFDLSNNRTKEAFSSKMIVLHQIIDHLVPYLAKVEA